MSSGEPAIYGLARRSWLEQAWSVAFWLLFVADLCVMQYLFAFALLTPFALMEGGVSGLVAWLPILACQAIYAAGLIYACVLRAKRPIVTAAILLATPIIAYGGWYLCVVVGLIPPALGPVLS
jgi:hypothetical protein